MRLIVNADDFGRSRGVNRGIVETHERGIVTSTSLMVFRPGAREAATYARAHPGLSTGLHIELPPKWIAGDPDENGRKASGARSCPGRYSSS